MYERSAIVLERCFDKVFGFYKENNIRSNIDYFNELIKCLKEYQTMIIEEENVLLKFDTVAKELEKIKNEQVKLCRANQQLEEMRNKLFNDLDANPNMVQNRLEKIESRVNENNERLKYLRENYIKTYVIFTQRQKERNQFAREKRIIESNHIEKINKFKKMFENISVQDLQRAKRIIEKNREELKNSIINAMIKNGKNEKVPFSEEVFFRAVTNRIDIATRELECYFILYDRFRKVLNELDSDDIRIEKYEKTLRDNNVKLTFLNAEKEYIIGFLDNERMTIIGGPNAHKKLMIDACKNFEADIRQIDNLYELIVREINNKATKKAYNELYNKTYLKEIQEKERKFEREVNNIKTNVGTVVNSNYWRIEGIKNIYDVFQEEITEKFNKDLSEYQIEEIEDVEEEQEFVKNNKKLIKNRIKEYEDFDENYFDDLDSNSKDEEYDNENYYEQDDLEYDYDEEIEDEDKYRDDYYEDEVEEDEYEDYYDEDEVEEDEYKDDYYEEEVEEDEYKDDYDEEVEEDEYEDYYDENEVEENDEYEYDYEEDEDYDDYEEDEVEEDVYEDDYEEDEVEDDDKYEDDYEENEDYNNYEKYQEDDDEEIDIYKNNYGDDDDDDDDGGDRIVSILTRISKEYDEKIKNAKNNTENNIKNEEDEEEQNPGFFNKLFKKN